MVYNLFIHGYVSKGIECQSWNRWFFQRFSNYPTIGGLAKATWLSWRQFASYFGDTCFQENSNKTYARYPKTRIWLRISESLINRWFEGRFGMFQGYWLEFSENMFLVKTSLTSVPKDRCWLPLGLSSTSRITLRQSNIAFSTSTFSLHHRSLTASLPLKNGGWKTILFYWEGNFSGAMLNFGRV